MGSGALALTGAPVLLVALLGALPGCGQEEKLTALVLAVDSNMGPQMLDRVTVDVQGLGMQDPAEARLGDGEHPLPRTLGLVHRGGALGPITITVMGRLAGSGETIERKARVHFVRDQVMLLRLNLVFSCVRGQDACGDGMTCGAGGCRDVDVEPGELLPWIGEVPDPLEILDQADPMGADGGIDDGGASDGGELGDVGGERDASEAGMCTAGETLCADGAGCRDLQSDPDHCGKCGEACLPEGTMHVAAHACEGGDCVLTCEPGFRDDDDEPGCETDTGLPFTPANFDPGDEALASDKRAALEVTCDATLDAGGDTGTSGAIAPQELCGVAVEPHVTSQAGGPDVVVVPLWSLRVAAGKTLRVVGERPVILAVFGDADVAGAIDVSAAGTTPGPGGNLDCAGSQGQPGESSTSSADGGGGGGGGGFGTAGAVGGTGGYYGLSDGREGGAAGDARGTPELSPLAGGCPGGDGGGNGGRGGSGGAGGGALQLSVLGTLVLQDTAVIAAAGGGGQASPDEEAGGGGGGSGGSVSLEADMLDIAAGAWVTANGGGGAEGNDTNSATGLSGADGATSGAAQAAGGSGGSSSAGGGGTGGSASGDAQPGQDGDPSGTFDQDDHGGGGGGGGGGRIHVRGVAACDLSGDFSPPAVSECP